MRPTRLSIMALAAAVLLPAALSHAAGARRAVVLRDGACGGPVIVVYTDYTGGIDDRSRLGTFDEGSLGSPQRSLYFRQNGWRWHRPPQFAPGGDRYLRHRDDPYRARPRSSGLRYWRAR